MRTWQRIKSIEGSLVFVLVASVVMHVSPLEPSLKMFKNDEVFVICSVVPNVSNNIQTQRNPYIYLKLRHI